MSPEKLQMVDDLLNYVHTYSPQPDTRASELFHAIVLSLYEAREHLDFIAVFTRMYGTCTRKAAAHQGKLGRLPYIWSRTALVRFLPVAAGALPLPRHSR
jgi:hypothetical protein